MARQDMKEKVHSANWVSVLVVDDDRSISKVIRHNLEDKDTRVVEAATGLDSLRILDEVKVDLVLLDLRLPDFSGWGILSLIRLTEPLCHIPVIILSVDPPNSALMQRLKPNDYIQKPFDVRELLMRVRKVIGSGSVNQ